MEEQPLIENQSLDDEIKRAKRAEGYIFLISRLNGGRLTHFWITQKFPREDIPIALAHYSESLKREMGATTASEPSVPEGERQLPPEYRQNKDEKIA